jgi:hypothetical protein
MVTRFPRRRRRPGTSVSSWLVSAHEKPPTRITSLLNLETQNVAIEARRPL